MQPLESEHARRVSGMFGRIAGWYDFLNHSLSLGQDVVWRRRLAARVWPESTGRVLTGRILDLAAGTMDVTVALRRRHPSCKVLAMDFALPMLQRGRAKLVRKGVTGVLAAAADGRALPLPEASVDCVTIAFGIRNIRPRQAAYAEILRVLAPGGRLCILEFGSSQRPIWKGLYNCYLNHILPAAGRLVSGDAEAYCYLAETIKGFPPPGDLARELSEAGFASVAWQGLMSGIVNIHWADKAPDKGPGKGRQ